MATLSLILSPASSQLLTARKVISFSSIQCCKNSKEITAISPNGQAIFPEKNPLLQSSKIPPPRPRRIILVRHGESEGNVDECVYTRVADPKIALTEKGKLQAKECGKRLRGIIEQDGANDWKVYFYVSPYRRTHETLQNLARAFERSRIAGMREEPRLREQDFGKCLYSWQVNRSQTSRKKVSLDQCLNIAFQFQKNQQQTNVRF